MCHNVSSRNVFKRNFLPVIKRWRPLLVTCPQVSKHTASTGVKATSLFVYLMVIQNLKYLTV